MLVARRIPHGVICFNQLFRDAAGVEGLELYQGFCEQVGLRMTSEGRVGHEVHPMEAELQERPNRHLLRRDGRWYGEIRSALLDTPGATAWVCLECHANRCEGGDDAPDSDEEPKVSREHLRSWRAVAKFNDEF